MKAKNKNLKSEIYSLISNPYTVAVILIFGFAIFLRFYDIGNFTSFGWDQVDNAWAANHILVESKFPLLGMQAKQNSGLFIGPYYYYFVSIFYFLTNLDPIASGIIAGVTSIFSLLVIYFITKKLFSQTVAIFAIFINTVSVFVLVAERVQWPVNFIPAIALIIFYALYKITTGNSKYIMLLALAFGVSLHIHFTAIYYPIIISLCLPFFPRSKETLKHSFFGFLIFIPFVLPTAIAFIQNAQDTMRVSSYGQSYYHGFHLRRVMQLLSDALIQFISYLHFDFLKPLEFVLIPVFIFIYLFKKIKRDRLMLCYLILIFFIVPWFVLSTYSGELTDYYFSVSRYISLLIISYLIYKIYILKHPIVKGLVIALLLIYAFFNLQEFFKGDKSHSVNAIRQKTLERINVGEHIPFKEGIPESYFYYYYMRKEGKKVY